MGGFSLWHWLIVGMLVLLLFGRGRFSNMMGDVAKGIKSFKKGMAEKTRTPASSCRRRRISKASRHARRDGRRPERRHARHGRNRLIASIARVPGGFIDDRMFDVAPTELLLVAVVAWSSSAQGPAEGDAFVGQWVGKARGMARHFRSGFDTMIREAELEEMEKKWRDGE